MGGARNRTSSTTIHVGGYRLLVPIGARAYVIADDFIDQKNVYSDTFHAEVCIDYPTLRTTERPTWKSCARAHL